MHEAITESDAAGRAGEYPIGAVVVLDGEIVARGRAAQRASGTQLAHAELTALQELRGERWMTESDAVVVTNLEPCPLCLGAVVMTDIRHVVFALGDPVAGAGRMLEIPYVRRHVVTYHEGLCAADAQKVVHRHGLQLGGLSTDGV